MKFDLFNNAAKAQEKAQREQEQQQAQRAVDFIRCVGRNDTQGVADTLRDYPDAVSWTCGVDDGSDVSYQTGLHIAATQGIWTLRNN